jgi:hypothetical protein
MRIQFLIWHETQERKITLFHEGDTENRQFGLLYGPQGIPEVTQNPADLWTGS